MIAWGFAWLAIPVALASSPAEVRQCLAANDVPCAETALEALGADLDGPIASKDPEILALAAETAFYAGRYDDAYTIVQQARDAGFQDPWDDLGLYQRTADVMKDWAEERRGSFVVRYRPGVDAILVEDAFYVLEQTEKNVAPLLGGPPPGPIILELYPDGRSFVACSSLSEEAVQTTGVVALSKWSRLLAISPRALGRGYEWQDTVAHEYIHLVVAHRTNDRTPVWMQEAIAKYLDNRWRDGKDHFRLGPRDGGLLADALAEEDGRIGADKQAAIDALADKQAEAEPGMTVRSSRNTHVGLVPFEDMHPSLALLPSAEMAALAYAQLAMLMKYSFDQGGEDVLTEVLPLVRSGTDPRDALATGAGKKRFEQLEKDWLAWMKAQRIEGEHVAEIPTVLDGGADAAESDPVLAEREDLARYVRLGDLLLESEHPKAALVEYAKALDPEEPPSPLLSNRVAQAHLALGDTASARAALEESLASYPEFALTHKTLGQILQKQGDRAGALEAFRRAADLNPFDPAVQTALAELYQAAGNTKMAARHEKNLTILRRGGQESEEVTMIRKTSPETQE